MDTATYAARGWPIVDPWSTNHCYQPCRFGLHVCGEHPDGINALTILNVPVATAALARDLFDRARAELAAEPGQPFDFVVDLQIDHDCDQDFRMNRQMLDRLIAMGDGQ